MRRSHGTHLLATLVRGVRDRAARSDLLLVAAALTCYAVLGVLPLVAIGTRVAAALFDPASVTRAAEGVARYVPGPLHLDRAAVSFARGASAMSWWAVLAALLPTSIYAEGTVRALERFSRAPERHSRMLRGRVLTLVFVAASVLAVGLLVGVLRPLLFDPFGRGLGARLLGILVAFNVLFFALFAFLVVLYRLFASTPIRPGPLAFASFAAASWLASQTLAYLAVVRSVSGVSRAYGGSAIAGAVAAIVFLVYLEHVVFLVGYALALRLHEEPLRVRAGD